MQMSQHIERIFYFAPLAPAQAEYKSECTPEKRFERIHNGGNKHGN